MASSNWRSAAMPPSHRHSHQNHQFRPIEPSRWSNWAVCREVHHRIVWMAVRVGVLYNRTDRPAMRHSTDDTDWPSGIWWRSEKNQIKIDPCASWNDNARLLLIVVQLFMECDVPAFCRETLFSFCQYGVKSKEFDFRRGMKTDCFRGRDTKPVSANTLATNWTRSVEVS